MIVLYFNPRPREEGDVNNVAIQVSDDDFNPRPREEGDVVGASVAGSLLLDFNPRPREEGDLFSGKTRYIGTISIHALVKRATIGWF